MPKWPWLILSKIGVIALIGYIAWLGWEHLGPRKPEIGSVRKELVDKVIPDIVEDIRKSRGTIRYAALLHFSNDPTDYFSNTLRSTIERSGVLDLRDYTMSEKVRNLLNLRQRFHGSPEDAVQQGRDLYVHGVLFGKIHSFESYPGGAKIDVDVKLADVDTGGVVFLQRYSKDIDTNTISSLVIEEMVQRVPWFRRLLAWAVLVLLLPVFTISFIRAMVRKESNKTNAFVLAVYTIADALLAYLLVGVALGSWWAVLVFIVAVAAAFVYNLRVMTFALRLEEA